MSKWDYLIESGIENYGGWNEGGQLIGSSIYLDRTTEFEMIAQQVLDPLRCLLGSVDRTTRQPCEKGHLIEEMGLIEKAVFKNSRLSAFVKNMTNGYYEVSRTDKSINTINKIFPKFLKHGEAELAKHKTFFPDDPLLTEISKRAYTLLITFSKSILQSIKHYPNRVDNPYTHRPLQNDVRALRESISKLLKRLKYKRPRRAPKRRNKRQKPTKYLVQPDANRKPPTPEEQKVIDDIIDLL